MTTVYFGGNDRIRMARQASSAQLPDGIPGPVISGSGDRGRFTAQNEAFHDCIVIPHARSEGDRG